MSTLRPGRPNVHYCLSKKKKDTVYYLHNSDLYDLKDSRDAVVNWGKLWIIAEMCLRLFFLKNGDKSNDEGTNNALVLHHFAEGSDQEKKSSKKLDESIVFLKNGQNGR